MLDIVLTRVTFEYERKSFMLVSLEKQTFIIYIYIK